MRADIHPKYKKLLIKFPDGSVFETMSTYHGEYYICDMFFKNHPAWNSGTHLGANTKAKKVELFNKRFGDIGKMSHNNKKED